MKFFDFKEHCQKSPNCPCDPKYFPCSWSMCHILNNKCIEGNGTQNVCMACYSGVTDPDDLKLYDKWEKK